MASQKDGGREEESGSDQGEGKSDSDTTTKKEVPGSRKTEMVMGQNRETLCGQNNESGGKSRDLGPHRDVTLGQNRDPLPTPGGRSANAMPNHWGRAVSQPSRDSGTRSTANKTSKSRGESNFERNGASSQMGNGSGDHSKLSADETDEEKVAASLNSTVHGTPPLSRTVHVHHGNPYSPHTHHYHHHQATPSPVNSGISFSQTRHRSPPSNSGVSGRGNSPLSLEGLVDCSNAASQGHIMTVAAQGQRSNESKSHAATPQASSSALASSSHMTMSLPNVSTSNTHQENIQNVSAWARSVMSSSTNASRLNSADMSDTTDSATDRPQAARGNQDSATPPCDGTPKGDPAQPPLPPPLPLHRDREQARSLNALATPSPDADGVEGQYNWQASKTTIKERLAFMFNNDTMADVHFLVGKGGNVQRIPAHKFILSIGSAVFDAMFNGGMATTHDEVELPDIEPSAFLATLRFLYSDEVTIGPETVMTTLYTAKKYAVPALESHCVDFLKKNLSPDNSFMLLTQARLFDEPQLAALCLETIDKNTHEAVSAEGFTDVDLETMHVVLQRDTLGIREVKLFGAVARWSESECNRKNLTVTAENKRQVLGRALYLIRFPLMNIEEFASGPAQSGLLLDSEVVSLFLYFTVNPKPTVNFTDVPRCCLTGKEQVVNRFCQTESRWGYSGTSDRIRFMVNRKIFIVGFGLYGSIHGATEYQASMQITHTDSSRVVGTNETGFPCDGTNTTFRVMFKEPVEIYPNMNYTAACTLKGPDSYYGTKGQRKVVHESASRERVVFSFSYAAGSNNGTSVEDGQIPEIIFYT